MDEYSEFQERYSLLVGMLLSLQALGKRNDSIMRISQSFYQKLKQRNLPEKHEECMKYFETIQKELTSTLLEVNSVDDSLDEPVFESEKLGGSSETAARRTTGRRIDKEFLTNLSIDLNTSEDVNDFLENL